MATPEHEKAPGEAPTGQPTTFSLGKGHALAALSANQDLEPAPEAPAAPDEIDETMDEIVEQQDLLERIHANLSEKQRRIDDLSDDDTCYEGYGEELVRLEEASEQLLAAQRLLDFKPDNAALSRARCLSEDAAGTLMEVKPDDLDDQDQDDAALP
ncbi:hypothetical protein SAMN03159362_3894 [Pseudomonas sp. NFIX51]|uniref:hypothetical protein n=1 Tax=Pseudomonas TaxID=286 RepID=UPI0008CA11A1|nr:MULTISPECIES: hypothetical protein [Pseudomonas]ROL92889.1 hypothetical protein BK637_02590 [Pseudomonas chlororaphis]WDH35355.1 hypothetical protein PUP62_00620 [Pseudomonas chlororaphis]WDH41440.1 hypothetical protein PUP51_00620 [Pseudomonas chlororaphis]SEL66785.1 hypothetical protein SAMN03159414_3091 [Pseudomonas sp. NFACC41-3]SMH55690.1 hypothetical protein SAMN03159362_3894 [Pseudomonas sp. NFIX51]